MSAIYKIKVIEQYLNSYNQWVACAGEPTYITVIADDWAGAKQAALALTYPAGANRRHSMEPITIEALPTPAPVEVPPSDPQPRRRLRSWRIRP